MFTNLHHRVGILFNDSVYVNLFTEYNMRFFNYKLYMYFIVRILYRLNQVLTSLINA